MCYLSYDGQDAATRVVPLSHNCRDNLGSSGCAQFWPSGSRASLTNKA